jgi:hypothetical protein
VSPIIAKDSGGGDFTPHPEGMHQMVCVDVIDHGIVKTTAYGDKHKITIRWQSDETGPKGHRLTCQKRYTLSLHEKSALRADLQSWRGKPFTVEEARGFDVEKLLGVNALVNIVHKTAPDGKVWANVASVGPIMKGMTPIAPAADYVRQAERPTEPEPGEVPHDEAPHPADMPAFEPSF